MRNCRHLSGVRRDQHSGRRHTHPCPFWHGRVGTDSTRSPTLQTNSESEEAESGTGKLALAPPRTIWMVAVRSTMGSEEATAIRRP